VRLGPRVVVPDMDGDGYGGLSNRSRSPSRRPLSSANNPRISLALSISRDRKAMAEIDDIGRVLCNVLFSFQANSQLSFVSLPLYLCSASGTRV